MRWLIRVYPRQWRERYGEEVADLLRCSGNPVRDTADVLRHAVLAWLEVEVVRVTTLVAAGASLVLLGFAVGQLADGVGEIHRHWWSGGALAAAVVTVAVAVTGERRMHRSQRHR